MFRGVRVEPALAPAAIPTAALNAVPANGPRVPAYAMESSVAVEGDRPATGIGETAVTNGSGHAIGNGYGNGFGADALTSGPPATNGVESNGAADGNGKATNGANVPSSGADQPADERPESEVRPG